MKPKPDRVIALADVGDELVLGDGEVVLVHHAGELVEVRRKPRYRWQHFHLGLWGLLAGKSFAEGWNTVSFNWWPVRHVGKRVRHTLYLKLSGRISGRGLRHEFIHVDQLARLGTLRYSGRYVRPRGRLALEAEANVELVRDQHARLDPAEFDAWLDEKARGMQKGYYLWLLTFRKVTVAEVREALLLAADVDPTPVLDP